MTDKTYSGWSNHATWLINVWTDGDDEIARISSKRTEGLNSRARDLKEYVCETYLYEQLTTHVTSLGVDLLNSALSDVDWHELVAHYEDCEVSTEDNDDE